MGKKLNFWAELYSESHDLDTMDEFQLSAEEWDALSEKDKYDLVEDWAEGQINCGYTELGEEPDFVDEEDSSRDIWKPVDFSDAEEEEVEEYPENFDDEDEWSDE